MKGENLDRVKKMIANYKVKRKHDAGIGRK